MLDQSQAHAPSEGDAGDMLHVGDSSARTRRGGFYLPVPAKFALVLVLAALWTTASVWLSLPWLGELSKTFGFWFAVVSITFIAYVPGFMNAFLVGSILGDRRPVRRVPASYPDLCVLVACYNEQDNIADTLVSLSRQDYPGRIEVVAIDDGSTDDTLAIARAEAARLSTDRISMRVLALPRNGGRVGDFSGRRTTPPVAQRRQSRSRSPIAANGSTIVPDTPGGRRSEVSRTSLAFSPKMARSSFSSGVSVVSPLGVTLPTNTSPGCTSAPT